MNWKKWAPVGGVVALGFWLYAMAGGEISGKTARAKVEKGAVLLDVRTEQEFQAGHLDGAINIPVQVLEQRWSELPKDKEIVVYCRSGQRSARAQRLLKTHGLTQVFDLGGMGNW